MLSNARKQTISVLELSSTNYWNAVENLNSHERALPVWTEVYVKVTPVDSNNTMDKVLGALGSLIEQFTGENLLLKKQGDK